MFLTSLYFYASYANIYPRISPFILLLSLSSFSLSPSFLYAAGTPAEIFDYGVILWETVFAKCFFLPIVAFLFVRTFHDLKLTSVYEVRNYYVTMELPAQLSLKFTNRVLL